MQVEIARTFSFCAAHALPQAGAGHQCRNTHGHNFSVEVVVQGEVDPDRGWLMDYGDLKRRVAPVISQLDHAQLNKIAGLENPTSENLARWIWDQLQTELPGLERITISETSSTRCTYRGDA